MTLADEWRSESSQETLAPVVALRTIQEIERAGLSSYGDVDWYATKLPFGRDTWAIQITEPVSWKVWNPKSNVFTVTRTGSTLTELSRRQFGHGYQFDSCMMMGIIKQISGTCYFNTAVNQLCLGKRCGPVVLKAVQTQVDTMDSVDKDVFYNLPLAVNTTCSMNWLDVLRLFYAIICPTSPSRAYMNALALNSMSLRYVNRQANITKQAVWGSGFRNKQKKVDGGHPDTVLVHMLRLLKIPIIHVLDHGGVTRYSHLPGADIVMVTSRDVFPLSPPVISLNDTVYELDSAALGAKMATGDHALTGLFCGGGPGLVDSNIGNFFPCNWLTGGAVKVTACINEAYRQVLENEMRCRTVYLVFTLYVKKNAPGAHCPSLQAPEAGTSSAVL